MAVTEVSIANRRSRASSFFELTKPRITFMVLIATAVGFYMGSPENIRMLLLIHTIVGTGLVAAGASAFNEYFERDLDARMLRTRTRPIPDGRLSPAEALTFSVVISAAGIVYLAAFVNLLTCRDWRSHAHCLHFSLHAAENADDLVHADRRVSWRNAAADGMGRCARAIWTLRGSRSSPFSSCGRCRTSSRSRGCLLKTTRGQGSWFTRAACKTGRQIILYCCALIPVSLLPTLFGATGRWYLLGALLLGFVYLGYGFAVALFRSNTHAQRLLKISVLYLPALFVLMMIDKA